MFSSQENLPNAGKLIQSLRSVGYDNNAAICDIVDNSIDAEANNIRITIEKIKDDVEITIVDDGFGMNIDTLDQALKLGSLTDRDYTSDLGKYGMGLCTASLSIAKKLEVLTKEAGSKVLYSAQDVDEIVKQNKFIKVLDEADSDKEQRFNFYFKGSKSGTVVTLKKMDRLQNKNIGIFANNLKKDIGQVYRYFLSAGKKILVNGEKVEINDPLMSDNKETKIYSDEEYNVYIPEKKIKEKIRIKVAILPLFSDELNKKLGINQPNQGFYILRNNREIASGKTLGVFNRHNDLNRVRIELMFSGTIDDEMGVNFAKQDVKPMQSILDKIKEETGGQIISIRRSIIKERGKVESDNVDHTDAEKVIAQKSKLLITPEATVERRKSSKRGQGDKVEPESEHGARENLKKIHTSPKGLGCRFDLAEMGISGPIYECYQEGKLVVIQYNVEHPFYQRMILEVKDDQNIVNAVDYLVYAMAAAELKTSNDENTEVINNIKSITSANLRTLLS